MKIGDKVLVISPLEYNSDNPTVFEVEVVGVIEGHERFVVTAYINKDFEVVRDRYMLVEVYTGRPILNYPESMTVQEEIDFFWKNFNNYESPEDFQEALDYVTERYGPVKEVPDYKWEELCDE